MKKLVIIGAGEFGHIVYEYFNDYSDYTVVAFAVERMYLKEKKCCGVPIVAFEDLKNEFPTDEYSIFVAVTYVDMNHARQRLYRQCKELGYHCASFIHPRSSVSKSAFVGENVMIMDNSSIQYNANIGNNTIIWNGVNVAHSTKIGENCWLAPSVAVAGLTSIGSNCFIGVNATIKDCVIINDSNFIGAGAVVVDSISKLGGVYVGCPAKYLKEIDAI